MQHMGTQKLETPRLILRRFTREDAPAMYGAWASDPEATRFVSWPAHRDVGVTRALLEQWEEAYLQDSEYNWCIVLRDGDSPIGSIGLVNVNGELRRAEMGYIVARSHWGQGIAAEAAAAVLDYCFGRAGFHRIAAVHHPDNPASGAVMRKLGMRREGLIREAHMDNQGRYIDVEQYAILNREWKERQHALAR